MSRSSIVLLPGLGANARLFRPQLEAFAGDGALVPDWPTTIEPTRGVESVAESLARSLREVGRLHEGTILVGFSFGGQVALSIARRAVEENAPAPRAIVLASGVRRTAQLTRRFRIQVAASRLLPDAAISWAAPELVARPFARVCGLDHKQALELQRMAAELDLPQFRRLARAACRWRFEADDERRLAEAGVRILHLHSRRDPVIPPPPAAVPFEAIDEPAHLVTWTHAERVNGLVENALAIRDPSARGPREKSPI